MLVPLSWLRDFVDIDEPVEAVDRRLTNAGLEVKGIETIGRPGADLVWDRDRIVLGQVLEVTQHPNADRLVLARVDYGAAEPEQVVTGAPNLFQFVGQGDLAGRQLFSPLALEGAELYDGHKAGRKKMTLKGRPLRGIHNKSMLCSEKELGISDEHEGIILMSRDKNSPDYTPGTPLQDVLGDHVLDIDIIPNIARCASILGVAREYAALTDQPWREPDYDVVTEVNPAAPRVVIRTEEPALNPRFSALVIEGVAQKPSPYWLQYRLRLAGQRPKDVVVDVSNYVMLEMGQPNHAFDYDFLRERADAYAPDGPVEIITRLPRPGEKLTTLDGVTHNLQPHNILVTDPAGALSLGGVMGGEESEIKPETTNVLLEAAAWNFINIRRTATDLGIHSDAAFRFSRGVHPSQAILGAKRASELLRRLAGGKLGSDIVDTYPLPPAKDTVALDLAYARRLSGLDLTAEQAAGYLRRLAFEVRVDDDMLYAVAPDYRLDIEGPHDLVEEICRIAGYDNIPSTVIGDTLPPQRANRPLEIEERIRDSLTGQGVQEVITYRLTNAAREGRLLVTGPADDRPYVTLTNPISGERAQMRHNLLAAVLDVAAANSRFAPRIALFEIGPVFLMDEDEILPREPVHLALAMTGRRRPAAWNDGADELYDFYDLKGAVESVFADLHLDVRYAAGQHPSFRPGRTAVVHLGETQIGVLGELHPRVVQAFDMRVEPGQAVLGAELDLTGVVANVPDFRPVDPISPFPPVVEDLAFIVDATVPADDVAEAIEKAGGYMLDKVRLFDVYEGAPIPAGKRSLAYRLTYQVPDRTLTDKDVGKVRGRIVRQLQHRLGATLRG